MNDERDAVDNKLTKIMRRADGSRLKTGDQPWLVSRGPSPQEYTIYAIKNGRADGETVLGLSDPRFFEKFEAEITRLAKA